MYLFICMCISVTTLGRNLRMTENETKVELFSKFKPWLCSKVFLQKAKCCMWGSNGLHSSMLLKVQESPQLKVSSVPTNPSFLSTRPLRVFFSTTKDDVLLYCRQVQKVAWSMKPKEVPALGNHCGRAKIRSRFISIYVLFFLWGRIQTVHILLHWAHPALYCKWVFCACFF